MEELETLRGTVESVVFRNQENGWTVFELACGDELCTVVGHVFDVAEGEALTVQGEWGRHPSYGRQFKAEKFEREMPATSAAMLRYLSSGAVKGIGPSTAKRMVDVFGTDTLDILENHPERLSEIRGISDKKAAEMSEAYKSQFGVRTCMLFLQQYGVTAAQAIRVWKRFGNGAVDMVKRNPYVLCESGLYIGFDRADEIAMQMGVDKGDSFRIHAGIAHILRHNLFAGGHTYIPREKLAGLGQTMLGIDAETAESTIDDMAALEEEAVSEEIGGREALFLPEAHRAENYIAGRLLLMRGLKQPEMGDHAVRIREAEEKMGITYARKQREAIETACQNSVMILTGGPGTGKTTTLNAIIHVYEGMGLKVALAAPTGRAAKRMSEVSGREAKTIHRLLEMSFENEETAHFTRNEKNPLDCDAVIVDELSMVDVMLLESLLRALKLSCRLVMVGDADQLPPVGAGNALRDMIDSGKVPVVVLDEIFRQAAKSLIVTNAHRIVRGEIPELAKRDGDFFFMPRYTAAQVIATVVELMQTRLPAAYGYSPLWDMQVLTPGRKGELGSAAFNKALQDALNPAGQGKTERPAAFGVLREGDKVMQIKNNYDLAWQRDTGEQGAGVYNGDVGLLERIDRRTGTLWVRYEDRLAEYGPDLVEELELAYAVTVHKSQGSEFKAVVLPLFSGAPMLFYRNLLYTAVTRAKEITILVGRQETVEKMVQNDRRSKRYTGLCAFLQAGEDE